MPTYPIQTQDGVAYSGPPGLEMLLSMEAPPYGTEIEMPVYDGSTGHFTYCYTALATIEVGMVVHLNYTGSVLTTGYANPRVVLPDLTGAIGHQIGVACETQVAAGGLWVQTKGRCFFARVDGATNAVVGQFLLLHASGYFQEDDPVATVAGVGAIYEATRHGSGGATIWTEGSSHPWTTTSGFPTMIQRPIYFVDETLAVAAQQDATDGDPACVVYLTGNNPIV